MIVNYLSTNCYKKRDNLVKCLQTHIIMMSIKYILFKNKLVKKVILLIFVQYIF